MGKISTQYASALYKTSENLKCLEKIYKEISLNEWKIIFSKENLKLLKNNLFHTKSETTKEILNLLEGKVENLICKFIEILIQKGHICLVNEIFDKYTKIYQEKKNITKIKIKIPSTIDDETLNKIKNKAKILIDDKDAILEFTVSNDKNILGGYIIEYGAYSYDASLNKALKNLKSSLSI